MGGGGLYSTVSDYLKFTRMILAGGTLDGARVLAAPTVAEMSSNAMGELRCRPLKSAAPGSTNDVDFLDGMQWGLSFLINPDPLPTGRSAGSLAWAGLANSYYWIDPVKQVAGVYATQLLPFFDADAVALFEAFESAVYEPGVTAGRALLNSRQRVRQPFRLGLGTRPAAHGFPPRPPASPARRNRRWRASAAIFAASAHALSRVLATSRSRSATRSISPANGSTTVASSSTI